MVYMKPVDTHFGVCGWWNGRSFFAAASPFGQVTRSKNDGDWQFRQLNGGLQTQATVSASDKCNSLIRSAH